VTARIRIILCQDVAERRLDLAAVIQMAKRT
jgi:hypothetical protein